MRMLVGHAEIPLRAPAQDEYPEWPAAPLNLDDSLGMRSYNAHEFNVQAIPAMPKGALKSSLLRKPVNLSARKELLDEARKLGLNLSRLFEEALDARLRESRVRHWQEENRAALEAFSRYIERNGIFGDSEERGF